MKSLILLGSGASVEAGIPTNETMAQKLIEKLDNNRDSDIARLLRFVSGALLKRKGELNQDPFQGVNIEELYTVTELLSNRNEHILSPFVSQWDYHIAGYEKIKVDQWGHPDLERSLEKLMDHDTFSPAKVATEIQKLIEQNTLTENRFKNACDRMLEYLIGILYIKDQSTIEYFKPMIDLGKEQLQTIISLNYDNAVELAASTADVKIGIGIENWNRTRKLTKPRSGLELIKLHGSIDWWMGSSSGEEYPFTRLVVKVFDPSDGVYRRKPAVIFGGENKLSAEGPYLDLFNAFRARLNRVENLVTIGYSFRDEHVNHVIKDWSLGHEGRTVTIIDAPSVERWKHPFVDEVGGILHDRIIFMPVGASEGIKQLFG